MFYLIPLFLSPSALLIAAAIIPSIVLLVYVYRKDRLEKEIMRAGGMLKNEKFLAKAPTDKVEEEKQKLRKYEDMLAKVEEELKAYLNS